MTETVFSRGSGWIPTVVREDGELRLMLGAGADANHDPRTFTLPLEAVHLAAIRDDLTRHLLLWSALLPLCDAAGTRGPLDEDAAVALLDPVLLAPAPDVDALFGRIPWDRSRLVAHGADIRLLERGELCAALRSATETPNAQRAQEYAANRRRAARGQRLGPLDTAILRYTGQYARGGTVPRRTPRAVTAAMLPKVMRVIAVAEEACAGLRIGLDPRRGNRTTDKGAWDRVATAVEAAVRRTHPDLADDTVRSVSFLMCAETATRTRSAPTDDAEPADAPRGGPGRSALLFTDAKGVEQQWLPGGPRSASAAFWEFVADRAAAGSDMFTLEDETAGEGVQLLFYADSASRVTTVRQDAVDTDSRYHVEFTFVDGLDAYRTLVDAFLHGGCPALDPHGPWTPDITTFERARKGRRKPR
ncbi:DUF6357 family protein [Streptomyces sp. NPDC060194]|uniref:DUF6357 family protein n=1 Tax=Streptomyces sp. NPDC060194 TaxID=3347069 RepID=UPI003653EE06